MRKAKTEGAGDPEVLFLGLEGSGKSLLVRRLKISLARRAVAKKSKGNQAYIERFARFNYFCMQPVNSLEIFTDSLNMIGVEPWRSPDD